MDFLRRLFTTSEDECESGSGPECKSAEWLVSLEQNIDSVGLFNFYMAADDVARIRQLDKGSIRTYFRHQLRSTELKEKHCHLKKWMYPQLKEDLFYLTGEVMKKNRRSRDTDYIELIKSDQHSLWYIAWLFAVHDNYIPCFGLSVWLHVFSNLYVVERSQFILSSIILLLHAPWETRNTAYDWSVSLYIVLMMPFKYSQDNLLQLVFTVEYEGKTYVQKETIDLHEDMTAVRDYFCIHYNGGSMEHPKQRLLTFDGCLWLEKDPSS